MGSYFVERILTIEPCVLCDMQRILFTWICGTSIFGFLVELIFTGLFLKNFFTNLMYNIFIWSCLLNIKLSSIFGILIAGRQSWLQIFFVKNIHKNIYSCSAGLEQLIMQHPLFMVFKMVLKGSLECSKVHFKILGLSLANWSLISFIIILLFSLIVIYKKIINKN